METTSLPPPQNAVALLPPGSAATATVRVSSVPPGASAPGSGMSL